MEYNRIPVVLKRYSFASKMQACTIESMKTMDFMSTVSPEILRTLILPWDIETFVIFAVKAQEYNNLDIRDKNGKYFYEIMQSIYKYKDPNKLQKNASRFSFSSYLVVLRFLMKMNVAAPASSRMPPPISSTSSHLSESSPSLTSGVLVTVISRGFSYVSVS